MSWLTVITPPAEAPLSLEETKAFLRIGTDNEDNLVAGLIAAAGDVFESETGLALVQRRIKRHYRAWPNSAHRNGVALQPAPVILLEAMHIETGSGVVLEDASAHFITLDDALVLVGGALPHIPGGALATVTFLAGFASAAEIPARYKLALLQIIAAAYARGGSVRAGDVDIGRLREVHL